MNKMYMVLKMAHIVKQLEIPGIEPGAFHMQSERSTTELYPHGGHLTVVYQRRILCATRVSTCTNRKMHYSPGYTLCVKVCVVFYHSLFIVIILPATPFVV